MSKDKQFTELNAERA